MTETMNTTTDAPTITITEPDDAWTHRRYFVDGREVARIGQGESRYYQHSPNHKWGRLGGTFAPVGECVDGCGWIATRSEWAVYLSGSHSGPRYYRNRDDAYATAERIAESARLCSQPVAARLCRLLKRHDGPCVPWA